MQPFVKIILKLIPISFALLCIHCHKEEISPRDYPRINTLEVTDINITGATLRAEFIYPGSSEISDHGFIWDTNEDLYLLNAEKISLGTASGKGTFKATVNYSLVRDRVYYVKSFAITDKYTVYGKAVKFKSLGCLPPEIFDITPNHGFDGDTIKITGKNFSSLPSNIKVTFGVDQAEIIEADKNEIILLVPVGYTNSGYISVNILVNNFQLEITNFLLDTVKLENIHPQVAKIPNTEIEITCNTLIRNIQNLSLETFQISTFRNTDNKIFFNIPPDSPVGYVRIKAVINNKSVVSTDSLLLISPWVKKKSCPMEEGIYGMYMTPQGFVINNKAYFYTLPVFTYSKKGEIWEYDPLYNSWIFCDTFPDNRQDLFAFAINEKVTLVQDGLLMICRQTILTSMCMSLRHRTKPGYVFRIFQYQRDFIMDYWGSPLIRMLMFLVVLKTINIIKQQIPGLLLAFVRTLQDQVPGKVPRVLK